MSTAFMIICIGVFTVLILISIESAKNEILKAIKEKDNK